MYNLITFQSFSLTLLNLRKLKLKLILVVTVIMNKLILTEYKKFGSTSNEQNYYFINIKQEGLDLFNSDILLKPVNKETADNISRDFLNKFNERLNNYDINSII